MFRTFAQFLFKLLFPEGQGGMKETFGNSGGEGRFIIVHKNGNSGEVGGLSWNSLRGGGMDIFWNYTLMFYKSSLLAIQNYDLLLQLLLQSDYQYPGLTSLVPVSTSLGCA